MEVNEKLASMEATLKAQIAAIENNVGEKNEGRLKELKNELSQNLEAWKNEFTSQSEANQKQVDTLETEIKKLKSQGMSAKEAVNKTIADHLAAEFAKKNESNDFKEQVLRGGFKNSPFAVKAPGTMTFGNSTTGTVVDRTYIPGIFGDARRRQRIREFIPSGTMAGDAIQYVVQSGGEGGANNVDEGGSKPQTDKDITLKSAPARKIAHHIRVSEELLNDLQGLATFLTTQGSQDVYDKEDQQLLFGTGAGTPTQLEGLTVGGALDVSSVSLTGVPNPQKVDAIIAGMQALASQEYVADTILINPADMYDIMILKGSDNDYLKRVNFTTDGRLVVAGIPVGVSTAVTAGNVLVAEMAKAAIMFQREGLSVRFYDQDQDNAILNLVTVVIEERIALAKPYQDAVFYDSFADVITAIS